MLKIDSENMTIAMTRGDTAKIMFSAVDEEGTPYEPEAGDMLKFSVAKKVGATPIFEIPSVMESDAEAFWEITIEPDNTNGMKFGDYAFDVQLTHDGGQVDTIIGKTDTISPTFRVWGEVATE